MTFLTYQLLPLNQTICVLTQGLKPFSICQETANSEESMIFWKLSLPIKFMFYS